MTYTAGMLGNGDRALFDAGLPIKQGSTTDLDIQVALIEEKWHYSYPRINYRALSKNVTPSPVTPGTPILLSGEVGKTRFDPLYGESVPVNPGDTVWKQPHASGVVDALTKVDATAADKWEDEVQLRARIFREAKDSDLHKWGFDQYRDLIVSIPTSMFDKAGFQPQGGDIFQWDDEWFEVLQTNGDGFWLNTNLKLYQILNCVHHRLGS